MKSPNVSAVSPIRALVLTMIPNGGAITVTMKQLGYTPYTLEDTFTHGRALTHPQEWLGILEGQKSFDTYFLNRTSKSKVILPRYDCIIGPPATLAFQRILPTCPLSTRIILVEEPDKELWARDMEAALSIVSNYKNHSGPGLVLFNMIMVMMDFYKCSTAACGRGASLYRQRTTGSIPTADRLAGSLELFEEHVRTTIPPDRLLVYRTSEGWEPLCRFLEVETPTVPFPAHDNGLDTFVKVRDALSLSRRVVAVGMIVILSIAWVMFSYAASEFREELKLFYWYTRKKFEPYFQVGEEQTENSMTLRKAMILAKKSALEYGKTVSDDNVKPET